MDKNWNSKYIKIVKQIDNVPVPSIPERNGWKETLYLLQSPKNAARLTEGIESYSMECLGNKKIVDRNLFELL
jgi:hypothetical protein